MLKQSHRGQMYSHANLDKKKSGQVIVEYLLLLVVAVGLAILITKQLANRDPNEAGLIVRKWHEVEKAIGQDQPDE